MRTIISPWYGMMTIPDKLEVDDILIPKTSFLVLVDRTLKATYKLYQDNYTLKWDAYTAGVADWIFDLWSGPILSDRGTGEMRRLILDNNNPGWEEVTNVRTRDIVFASNVGFVMVDQTNDESWRRYFLNGSPKREQVI